MSRGKSSVSKPTGQGVIGTTLLPLGNVACGALYYMASFMVIGNVYAHAMTPSRPAAGSATGSVFMVCIVGLAVGAVQAAVIRQGRLANNNSANSTTLDIRWPLATAAGYFA